MPPLRLPEEIVESTRYGRLYLIHKIHGRKIIALRARRGEHDRDLVVNTNEKRVFDLRDLDRVPVTRDLIFIDSNNHMALWVPHGQERRRANTKDSDANGSSSCIHLGLPAYGALPR